MNKKISGLGVVGGGKYETVFIAGMGTALQNIEAEKLIVEGMFKGKGVYHTSEIQIEGIAKISDSDFADHLTVSGKAKITANRDTHSTMVCQGSIIMRCDSDSGKKLIKSMVLRTADRQGMC